jgi:hypothetical protein
MNCVYNIQSDSKVLSAFPLPTIFHTGTNKIKLLMQYENVTKKIVLFLESICRMRGFLGKSSLKIIGHRNPENNLESPCVSIHSHAHTKLYRPSL